MDANVKKQYHIPTDDQSPVIQGQTVDKDHFSPNLECGDHMLNRGQALEHTVRHGDSWCLPDDQILITTDHISDVTTNEQEDPLVDSECKYRVDSGGQTPVPDPHYENKTHTQMNSLCEHTRDFSPQIESEWILSGPALDGTPQTDQVDLDKNEQNINPFENKDSCEQRMLENPEYTAKMWGTPKEFVAEYDNEEATKANWSKVDLEMEHRKMKILFTELYRMTLLHKQVDQQCHGAVHMADALQQKLDEEIKSHTEDINQIRTTRVALAYERDTIKEEMEALQRESEMKQMALLMEIETLQKVPVLSTQAQDVSESEQEDLIAQKPALDVDARSAHVPEDKQLVQNFKAEMAYFRDILMKEVKELKGELHNQTTCSHLSSDTSDVEKDTLVFERHIDTPGQIIHHLITASVPIVNNPEEAADHQKLPIVQRSIWKRLRNFLGLKSRKKQKFRNVKL